MAAFPHRHIKLTITNRNPGRGEGKGKEGGEGTQREPGKLETVECAPQASGQHALLYPSLVVSPDPNLLPYSSSHCSLP